MSVNNMTCEYTRETGLYMYNGMCDKIRSMLLSAWVMHCLCKSIPQHTLCVQSSTNSKQYKSTNCKLLKHIYN